MTTIVDEGKGGFCGYSFWGAGIRRSLTGLSLAVAAICLIAISPIVCYAVSGGDEESEFVDVYGYQFEEYDSGRGYLVGLPGSSARQGNRSAQDVSFDSGLLYILSNGYPAVSFPKEGLISLNQQNDLDYFITQTAIWLYFGYDEDAIVSGVPEKAKDLVRKYATPLAERASEAARKSYEEVQYDCVIHIDDTLDHSLKLKEGNYESSPRSVTIVGGNKYRVAIKGFPRSCVRGGGNVERAAFWSGESFMINIPAVDLTDVTEAEAIVTCEVSLPKLMVEESRSGELIVRLSKEDNISEVSRAVTWSIPGDVNFVELVRLVLALAIIIVMAGGSSGGGLQLLNLFVKKTSGLSGGVNNENK